MQLISVLLHDDIILDQEAFGKAADEFAQLKTKLTALNEDIDRMISLLNEGFNTPGGRKFVSLCRSKLQQPIGDQQKVLDHIAQTLEEVRRKYAPVFDEYERLNGKLNQYAQNN